MRRHTASCQLRESTVARPSEPRDASGRRQVRLIRVNRGTTTANLSEDDSVNRASPPDGPDARRAKRLIRIGGAVTVPAYIVVMFLVGLAIYPERSWQENLIYVLIGAAVLAAALRDSHVLGLEGSQGLRQFAQR